MAYRECRKLNLEDNYSEIVKALEINNNIWNIKSNLTQFIKRAKNSYLIGIFENNILKGTISGISLNKNEILNNKKFHTWNGVTSNGTFDNVDENGNTICCVAITSNTAKTKLSKKVEPTGKYKIWINLLNDGNYTKNYKLLNFINENINNYIKSNLDPVINFHKKNKGDILGAKVIKILNNGRVEDKDSLGFNVLMEYPEITSELRENLDVHKLNCDNMGLGKALIIGVLKESLNNNKIKYIIPYSRPVKYRYYLTRALYRISKNLEFENTSEKEFYNSLCLLV